VLTLVIFVLLEALFQRFGVDRLIGRRGESR
jgi:hypothetical protein